MGLDKKRREKTDILLIYKTNNIKFWIWGQYKLKKLQLTKLNWANELNTKRSIFYIYGHFKIKVGNIIKN